MSAKNPYYDPTKAHHTAQGFRNPEQDLRAKDDLKRWQKERKQQGLPKAPQQGYQQFISDWWQKADFSGNDDRLWFLGHASLLLRVDDLNILMDPVFSDRASPLSFYGPKRKTPVAATVDELPRIDVILISHSHYDHLDNRTIRQLIARFPLATFIVPLGLKRWFTKRGAKQVSELDWWDSLQLGEFSFHAVPAKHWTMRTPWDRNQSLWCGWVVQHPQLNFYFSGDSAYSQEFAEIGRRLGPFDLAALPIGAYAPRWFMQSHHMDPQQAVEVFKEINCQQAVAIHWGVFELADESLDEPQQELAQALDQAELPTEVFRCLKIGQSLSSPKV